MIYFTPAASCFLLSCLTFRSVWRMVCLVFLLLSNKKLKQLLSDLTDSSVYNNFIPIPLLKVFCCFIYFFFCCLCFLVLFLPLWLVSQCQYTVCRSVYWCHLFAMFGNQNSCCTMQLLEHLPSQWVVHMSRCRIRSGCGSHYDQNNGNQTLCFTGSHFRCYVWLELYIHRLI